MVGGKHALVVVACIAGVGAWGATVTVANGDHTYASELFGADNVAIEYPAGETPMVQLTIPEDAAGKQGHSGEAEVTFTIYGGTFDANVRVINWDQDLATGSTDEDENTEDDYVAAPGTAVSIVSGGRKGESHLTIKLMAATTGTEEADAGTRKSDLNQRIAFDMPVLTKLTGLAGANPKDPHKRVWLNATSRIISGEFSDGPISGVRPHYVVPVVGARDSLTLEIAGPSTTDIAIDDDAEKGLTAFRSLTDTIPAGRAGAGHVEIATVTIMTKQVMTDAMGAEPRELVGYIQDDRYDAGDNQGKALDCSRAVVNESPDAEKCQAADKAAANALVDFQVYKPAKGATGTVFHDILGLDGEDIDAGLRGTFSINAVGTRELFNEGDALFVDYDKDGKMGAGEAIVIDGATAMGSALSIDADNEQSDSFDADGKGEFKVYYMPGGKMDLNHGAMINLTAMVNYSDPTAIDEKDEKTAITLNFKDVGSPVRAYAIPHSTNGVGDKGNVRVRCEQPAGAAKECRVFLECWDDIGERGFGEAPMIADSSLTRWTSTDIEGVTGLEPSSRLSCRVLSKGMVTVQQLTRDGNSGTLVNNTFVGGDM